MKNYSNLGKTRFEADELIQSWFVRHIQIIGEAAYKLPTDFKSSYPAVPWDEMVGMRHILVHDSFEINLKIVWLVVKEELPSLKIAIQQILNSFKDK